MYLMCGRFEARTESHLLLILKVVLFLAAKRGSPKKSKLKLHQPGVVMLKKSLQKKFFYIDNTFNTANPLLNIVFNYYFFAV